MTLENIEALILCGGLGRRLQSAVPELPKCLAPVGDRPFLEFVLLYLRAQGIRSVTLCVGHRSQQVAEYFESGSRWEMTLTYSHEQQPLGTAGALKNAKPSIHNSPFLVLNGDSILEVNLAEMIRFHESRRALGTIALAHVPSAGRYGSVRVDHAGNITGFLEKAAAAAGGGANAHPQINAGMYVFRRDIFDEIPSPPPPVSLETDVFPRFVSRGLFGFPSDGYFVDIGVPDDYARAQRELPRRILSCAFTRKHRCV